MKKVLLLIPLLLAMVPGRAQDYSFEAKISTDSLLMDNNLEVNFQLKNVRGAKFEAPDFEGFQLIAGPNQSSMTSVINGEVTSTLTYTFFLRPIEPGNYFIAPASIETEEGILESQPLEVIVLPNPDGIQQDHSTLEKGRWPQFRPVPPLGEKPKPRKPRKKRRIYQI